MYYAVGDCLEFALQRQKRTYFCCDLTLNNRGAFSIAVLASATSLRFGNLTTTAHPVRYPQDIKKKHLKLGLCSFQTPALYLKLRSQYPLKK